MATLTCTCATISTISIVIFFVAAYIIVTGHPFFIKLTKEKQRHQYRHIDHSPTSMLPLAMTGYTTAAAAADTTSATPRGGTRKGAWSQAEDALLTRCIEQHGSVRWSRIPQLAGLNRCRKSCRLRWLNYLNPTIKRGNFDEDEDDLIIRLHKLLGNRWSLIAGRLPGRTANDVKNYWNSHLSKKIIAADKKHGVQRAVTLIKPQPRTMPVNWRWSRKPKRRVEPQKEEPVMKVGSSVAEDRGGWTDHLIVDDDKHEEGKMEGQHFGFDCIGEFREEEMVLEGMTGWENLLSDIGLWS